MQIGEYQNIDFMGEISIRALRIIVNDTGIFYKLPSIRNNQINKAYRFAVNQKIVLELVNILNKQNTHINIILKQKQFPFLTPHYLIN